MKFLIPSTGRSDIIKETLDLYGSRRCLVYVKPEEFDTYAKAIGESLVRKLPKGTYGMGAIRKFMLEENMDQDYVFMSDDDVVAFEYKFSDRMEIIVDTDHIRAVIENWYQVAHDLKTPLFGCLSALGPMLYTQMDHVHFSGAVICGIGIIPEFLGGCMFDPRMVLNEDYDFALQVKYHHRFLFMDNRYGIRARKIWLSKGGCSTLRNLDTMKACHQLLKQKWGRVVQRSPKKDNQVVIRVPF